MTISAASSSPGPSTFMPNNRDFTYARGTPKALDHLKCKVCGCPAVEPVQANCPSEHLFCTACVKPLLKKSRTCPRCQQPVTCLLEARKAIVKALEELDVHCPNQVQGCREVVSRGRLDGHLTACPYEEAQCGVCGAAGTRLKLTHQPSCPQAPRAEPGKGVVAGRGGQTRPPPRPPPTAGAGPPPPPPAPPGAPTGRAAPPRPPAGPLTTASTPAPRPPAPPADPQAADRLRQELAAMRAEMQATLQRVAQQQRSSEAEELHRAKQEREQLEAQVAAQQKEIQALGALVQSYDREQRRREAAAVTFKDSSSPTPPRPVHLDMPKAAQSSETYRLSPTSNPSPQRREDPAVWGAALPRDVALAQSRRGPAPGGQSPLPRDGSSGSYGSGSRSAHSGGTRSLGSAGRSPHSNHASGTSSHEGARGPKAPTKPAATAQGSAGKSGHGKMKKLLGLG